jgi:hypothetical protein
MTNDSKLWKVQHIAIWQKFFKLVLYSMQLDPFLNQETRNEHDQTVIIDFIEGEEVCRRQLQTKPRCINKKMSINFLSGLWVVHGSMVFWRNNCSTRSSHCSHIHKLRKTRLVLTGFMDRMCTMLRFSHKLLKLAKLLKLKTVWKKLCSKWFWAEKTCLSLFKSNIGTVS